MSGVHHGGSRSRQHRQIGSSSSSSSSSHPYTRTKYVSKSLRSILVTKGEDEVARAARLEALSAEEQRKLFDLEGGAGGDEMDWEDDQDGQDGRMEEVLRGNMPLGMSHEGGELDDLAKEYQERTHRIRIDYRTRSDRAENTHTHFAQQLHQLTGAYMQYTLERSALPSTPSPPMDTPPPRQGSSPHSIRIVSIFESHIDTVLLTPQDLVAVEFLRKGSICCSPNNPTVGIDLKTLELFHCARLRCPQLSIHSFVKTLSDLHTVQFRRYLATQFSIAYDVYIAIRTEVDKRVQKALKRDEPNWRLKHACPACTNKLQNQLDLVFKMLIAMDGNDSLKRLLRRTPSDDPNITGPSNEHKDTRSVPGDYYISREDVNVYARELVEEATKLEVGDPDYNPCAERWKNMIDEITNKMWGIFDETGVFMAFCRHGFTLVITDMVRSGEQTKYPLACVKKMLDTFGSDLGVGYDTGCQFKTRLNNSSLGPLARQLNYRSLVDLFHCHAHRRLCQLAHLPTYTKGLGIEDLGMCERAFSQSNGLAGTTRRMSAFHRKQAIVLWFASIDNLETYQNLTTFLLNNYRQAFKIIEEGTPVLARVMLDLEIGDPATFNKWLEEEKTYLEGLTKEPEEETLQVEYYQKLLALWGSEAAFNTSESLFSASGADNTRVVETKRRQLMEVYKTDIRYVQILEAKLNTPRWEAEGPECMEAMKLLRMRKYQRSLDHLEGLIVARIFELSKANRSQTGYALRKHIGDALQKRSSAIRSALDTYNSAAKALAPPRQTLKWDQVVDYAFLSDFDLLRDTRQDIRHRPWATPAGRLAMDTHFKIIRAGEELSRLNYEVQSVATHLVDEDIYLRSCEDEVTKSDAPLGHQIFVHRMVRGRFNAHHHRRLLKISLLPGFTGTITPGISIECASGAPGVASKADRGFEGWRDQGANSVDDDEQQREEDEEEQIENALQAADDVVDIMIAVNNISLTSNRD